VKFKKIISLICAFIFMFSNSINICVAAEYDVMLVGYQGAGKTSVYFRMFSNTFADNVKSTVGGGIRKIGAKDGNQYNICDFAGNKNQRVLASKYLSKSKIIVFFVDITSQNSIDDIDEWMERVRVHCLENTKFILAVNKIDMVSVVNRDTIVAKANEYTIKNIYYISAKTGEGIDVLYSVLRNMLGRPVEVEIDAAPQNDIEEGTIEAEIDAAPQNDIEDEPIAVEADAAPLNDIAKGTVAAETAAAPLNDIADVPIAAETAAAPLNDIADEPIAVEADAVPLNDIAEGTITFEADAVPLNDIAEGTITVGADAAPLNDIAKGTVAAEIDTAPQFDVPLALKVGGVVAAVGAAGYYLVKNWLLGDRSQNSPDVAETI
jgi:small GTP-binding protein